MDTSLIFRVAEFQNSIDLTIRGPFFWERGKSPDWQWNEFFLNGVRWKGRTIPKLPILEPDKVTTLPLDIRLTEEYVYELADETEIDGRPAYAVDFRPKGEVTDKPIYRGRAWIDRETFALLRRESIQLNLKGDTLSNVQTEYYSALPGDGGIVLPSEDPGQPGVLDRRPDDDGHSLHPDVECDDRPAGLPDQARRGLRVGRADGARHRFRPALPDPRPQRPDPARRRGQAHAPEPLRARRRVLSARRGLPGAAARSPVLRLRHVGQEQAALGVLRGSAAASATTPIRRFWAAASTSGATSSPSPSRSPKRTTSTA